MAGDTGAGAQSHSSEVLNLAADKAQRYVRDVAERRVGPSDAAVAVLAEFNEPFPPSPRDPCDVIARLDQIGSPATVATTGGRYFGFVIGGSLPAAQAANWFVDLWDQNACLERLSPVSIALEEIALGWLLDILGLPSDCGGAFVTG